MMGTLAVKGLNCCDYGIKLDDYEYKYDSYMFYLFAYLQNELRFGFRKFKLQITITQYSFLI